MVKIPWKLAFKLPCKMVCRFPWKSPDVKVGCQVGFGGAVAIGVGRAISGNLHEAVSALEDGPQIARKLAVRIL